MYVMHDCKEDGQISFLHDQKGSQTVIRDPQRYSGEA
jgi:hypothetical protein